MSVSSTNSATLPLASHSWRLQSPFTSLPAGVPAGARSSTHVPSMHATVLHGPLGAHCPSITHPPAPPPPPPALPPAPPGLLLIPDDDDPDPVDDDDGVVPVPSEQAANITALPKQPKAIQAIRCMNEWSPPQAQTVNYGTVAHHLQDTARRQPPCAQRSELLLSAAHEQTPVVLHVPARPFGCMHGVPAGAGAMVTLPFIHFTIVQSPGFGSAGAS
jgi:hypothetical protein